MARGGYWAMWVPPERGGIGELERLPNRRHAIACAETSLEQQGCGGAIVFSRIEGHPFILLRKLGRLWPEADNYREGQPIELEPMYCRGIEVRLALVDLPSRQERKQSREAAD
jgi:hypothetical protein